MKQRYHYGPGRHYFDQDLILCGSDLEVTGEGAHETTLVFPPGCGLVLDQRDVDHQAYALEAHDFGVDIEGEDDSEAPLITLWGQGTANWMQPSLDIWNIQFGSTDKRPVHHPSNPGPERVWPRTHLELSGVFGLRARGLTFGAQLRGSPADLTSSVRAAVKFSTSAGVIVDIDGGRYPARSMKNVFRDCQMAPGIVTPFVVDEDTWVEGLHLDHCLMEGMWEGPHLRSESGRGGFDFIMHHCHLAFYRRGVVLHTGASCDISHNSLLAMPGHFAPSAAEPHPSYIRLGEYSRTFGVVQSVSAFNRFMMADPDNRPKYGVVLAGASRNNRIGPNRNQIVPIPFLEVDIAQGNEFIA